MKKLRHTITYYVTVWILIIFFFSMSSALITLQTPWGQKKVQSLFITYANRHGIALKIEKISGILPFQYNLKNISLEIENKEVYIQDLKFRISFFPLLINHLNFKSFIADNIDVSRIPQNQTSKVKTPIDTWFSPAIKIKFSKITLNNLNLNIQNSIMTFDVKGKLKIKKLGREITSKIKIKRDDFNKSYIDLFVKAYKKNRHLDIKTYSKIETTKAFYPFFTKNIDASFDLHLDAKGSLDSFEGYFSNNKKDFSKITGKAFGSVFKIQKNATSLLERKTHFSFDLSTFTDLSINISRGLVKNELLSAYADVILTKDFRLDKSNLKLRIDELTGLNLPILIGGSLNLQAQLEKTKVLSHLNFKDFRIENIPFLDFKVNLSGNYSDKTFTGQIDSKIFALNQAHQLASNLYFKNYFLKFSNFSLKAPSSQLSADFMITPSLALIGEGKLHFSDFSQIRALYPNLAFNSLADVAFEFKQKMQNDKPVQNLAIKANLENYYLNNLFGKKATFLLDIDQPFSKATADFDLNLTNAKLHDLNLNEINIITSTKNANWPYTIKIAGVLIDPFEIDSYGFWHLKDADFNLNVQDLKGHVLAHNFISPKPIKLEKTKSKFSLNDFRLEFADSSIFADINFTDKTSHAMINLKNFPLDFLSVNPLDIRVKGYTDLQLTLNQEKELKGELAINLKNLELFAFGDIEPLIANGTLNSTIKNSYLNLDGNLKVKDSQLMSFKGSIPLDLDLVDLNFRFNHDKKLNLDIAYNGRVEEILDFINIGPQRLEGNLKSELHFSNILKDLNIAGESSFDNGYYENYYTGSILKNIQANLTTEKEKIILNHLKASDTAAGNLLAQGEFSISEKNNFPFYFQTQINNFLCVDTDIIKTTASADLKIKGDKLSSLSQGKVKINKMQMTIPEKLPVTIPDLKIDFISRPFKKSKEEKPFIYPIHLNFEIDASNPIDINGQGLFSTWKGAFKVGGNYMNLETYGQLQLIKGKYVFSGRQFNLTKGTVAFTGKINEMPNLNITAKMNQQGVDVIANLQGPLDRPKIFFTSDPPLPSGSILSLLIFGQEISNLNEKELIELATALGQNQDDASLKGAEGAASLGIDRFNIIQPSTTDPFASDQMAIKLGKYITEGIIVSISQGQEQGSSNIIVEIDLKQGLIFQAESQQKEEQGKFSLKLRHNY